MYESTLRHPHGRVEISDPYGEIIEYDTHQCPHCGTHWRKIHGSKRPHMLCRRCHDPKNHRSGWTCSNPACMVECVPTEQGLENLEAGRPWNAPRPDSVNVPQLLWTPEGI